MATRPGLELQSHGLPVNTPIERLVLILCRRMGIEESYDYKVDKYIRILKDNWIATLGTLLRLPKGSLEKLGLPVGLLFELERLQDIQTGYSKANYVHVDESQVTDQRFQIKLSESHKELVLSSFRALTRFKAEDERTGMQLFETKFYNFFFEKDPAAQRLFDVNDIAKQSKAFVRMLYWIVENIDNSNLSSVLSQLGGRHLIYGVSSDEYKLFAEAVCSCIKDILGAQFTSEMGDAWKIALISLSDLMVRAGEITKSGFTGEVRRLRENGVWGTKHVVLRLDTVFLFRDRQRTDLYGQFPLRDMTIQFPKELESTPYCFQLSSFDPPFLLTLAALDAQQFKGWMSEIDWRIQALQRVYKDYDESSMATSESSLASGTSEGGNTTEVSERDVKAAKHKISKRQKRKDKGGHELDEFALQLDVLLSEGLQLTDEEKDTIRRSWTTLTGKKFVDEKSGLSKSGISRLFEDFYTRFFEEDPTGKRLFENSGLKAQGRALVSMIGMIVSCLDNFSTFVDKIMKLGGRHNIYGVKQRDYAIFEKILSETIAELVSGSEKLETSEVCGAWNKVIRNLGRIMYQASLVSARPTTVLAQRKIVANGAWKKTAISLSLDSIHVYRNEEAQKLRSSLNLKSVTDLEVIHHEDGMPHEFGVRVLYGPGENERAVFSFPKKEDATRWMEELDWRVQAQHRVYKFDEDMDSSESTEGGGTANRKKKDKGHGGKNKFSLGQKGRRK